MVRARILVELHVWLETHETVCLPPNLGLLFTVDVYQQGYNVSWEIHLQYNCPESLMRDKVEGLFKVDEAHI